MRRLLLLLALLLPVPALAQDMPDILPLRERARVQDAWLAERLDTVVPRLMREQGFDMWVLIAREYLEDPVMSTMLNATSMRARRRTILIFHDPGGGRPVERLTVSRYGLGGLFQPSWDPAAQPDQFARLAAMVAERNPRRIAINVSPNTAFADGLTHSQYQGFDRRACRRASARGCGRPTSWRSAGWRRAFPAEMARYPEIVRIAHAIIAEGFSDRTIRPGTTTAADLQWWYRERIAALGLATWFHPSVAIFRRGAPEPLEGDTVIQRGDMLWTDFGITYLGLNTDTQQLAYVLRPGERDVPGGLRLGLAAANRAQDMLMESFRTGLSGNEILAAALRPHPRRRASRHHLLPPARLSRPWRRRRDRLLGQSECRSARRPPAAARHRLVDRAQRPPCRARMGRAGDRVPARGGCLFRRPAGAAGSTGGRRPST